MSLRRVPRALVAAMLGLGLAVGVPARAGPVLHEYFEVDLQEDLKLGATTRDGSFPAALEWLRANEAATGGAAYQVAPTQVRRLPQR